MKFRLPEPEPQVHFMIVTALRRGRDVHPVAAALAAAAASGGRPCLLVDICGGRRQRAGIFSTALSRGLAEILSSARIEPNPVLRGGYCALSLAADSSDSVLARLAEVLPEGALCIVAAPPEESRGVIEAGAVQLDSAVLVAELPRDRALAALTCRDLSSRGIRCRLWKQPVGAIGAALPLIGLPPVGRTAPQAGRLLARLVEQGGQVTVLVTALLLVAVLFAGALVAFGGALTGKGRMQRAADLAAVSAARSLRDDLPRRLSPAMVNGLPNPYHLSRARYLARARSAAIRAALANDAAPWRIRVLFPDRLSPAPLSAEVRVLGRWSDQPLQVKARAEAQIPLAGVLGGASASASASAGGGDYSGPLATRQGRQMRPDVALAFDRLAAAAGDEGHHLIISSAYRSDAEQAVLFAANPDPKWVAPPGTSLHRCGTELDLGPASAYGWLAANAPRYGFALRYPWEPWHMGFVAGPPPCSAAAEKTSTRRGDGLVAAGSETPSYVPRWLVPHLQRASARWGVPVPLLAAQLQAESNFNPTVVSSAGAQGIAQFMPGTAAAYGLRDPFDPAQAVMAQAHLMADLLRQFDGSIELALAAYNAGPGAVMPCMCVPSYPETRAYVSKITALLAGSGSGLVGGLVPAGLEIQLVH